MKKIIILLVSISALGLIVWYTIALQEKEAVSTEVLPVVEVEPVVIPEPTILYGYEVDSMVLVNDKVKRNENLSEILGKYNISNDDIFTLVQRTKKIFDVRKIGVRKPYTLICKPDSLNTAVAMIYKPNAIDYVIFHLEDSIYTTKGANEVVSVEKEASGIITNSLAVTMDDQGLSPQLTNDFADIFAWKIDFFRLYPGDRFKVIYEEKSVGDEVIGIGKIKGAVFEHQGSESYAFFYDQGTGVDYFDEEGNSLRKAFLKYPVQFSRISSRYSGRRYHPVQKRYKAHRGTDFAAPRGTPIRSVGEGVVVAAYYQKYNGNFVKIKHNSIYSTQYLHMSKIASGMKPGKRVKQGQVIGYVGSTGLARGNHVCFRFWKHGQQVDGLRVELPPSEPISDDNVEKFNQVALAVKNQLTTVHYPANDAFQPTGE